MNARSLFFSTAVAISSLAVAHGAPEVKVGHGDGEDAFEVKGMPAPRQADAAGEATFTIIAGKAAFGPKKVNALNDGLMPMLDDDPSGNFFFAPGETKRLQIDLGKLVDVREFNSYSWHPGARGPQVYRLYGSDGKGANFDALPEAGKKPEECGWKFLADVDTRKAAAKAGGQYVASVSDSVGSLGSYRYFLMDVAATDPGDAESDTFFSEIDVVDKNTPAGPEKQTAEADVDHYKTADGKARFTIVYGDAPDLKEWSREKLVPQMQKWYPIICDLLKSEGFQPPKQFLLKFTDEYKGVAATARTYVMCDPSWYRENLDGEAVGSIIHELVHVVQQYWFLGGRRTPTWISEGIADYVRWEMYEPTPRFKVTEGNVEKIHYDQSYQTTADFLKWVAGKYDKDLVSQLNAAARDGSYNEDFWKKNTGRTVQELGAEWKASYAEKLGVTLPKDGSSGS